MKQGAWGGCWVKNIDGIECIRIALPNSFMILLKAKNGYVMCGYLNMETAEKLGDIACIVRGINTVEEALNAKIVSVSAKAREIGIKEGMVAKEALAMMK